MSDVSKRTGSKQHGRVSVSKSALLLSPRPFFPSLLTRTFLLIDRRASDWTRTAGLIVVIAGSLLATVLLNGTPATNTTQLALVTTSTSSGTTQQTSGSAPLPVQTVSPAITIDQGDPLQGTAQVTVTAPQASLVQVYIFEQSWQNKKLLGTAQQVSVDTWLYKLDTTKLTDGLNYRISAGVWTQSSWQNNYDYQLTLQYLRVLNNPPPVTITNSTGSANPTSGTSTLPSVSPASSTVVSAALTMPILTLADTVSQSANAKVAVSGASSVALIVNHIASGKLRTLDATQQDSKNWRVTWDTDNFPDGLYRVFARAKSGIQTLDSRTRYITVQNQTPAVATSTPNTSLIQTATTSKNQLPTLSLLPPSTPAAGTIRLEAAVRDGSATAVFFYRQDKNSTAAHFLGAATSNGTSWVFPWYTLDTPNGDYWLVAKAKTTYGLISSTPVGLSVLNQSTVNETPTATAERAVVVEASADVQTDPVLANLLAPIVRPGGEPIVTSNSAETTVEEDLKQQYVASIERLLAAYGTSLRLGDTERRVAILGTERDTLISRMLASAPDDADRQALRQALLSFFEKRFLAYDTAMDHIDAYLKERSRTDLTADNDKDGISNFDEVTLYHTDPLVADSDSDGFIDSVELVSGYDPHSAARETVITYESPLETGVVRDDLLTIKTVTPVQLETAPTSTNQDETDAPALELSGQALPNSFATIYIFSTPLIVTVRTESDGSWRYRFTEELADGTHQVYVGVTDNAGRIVAKSQPFFFTKEAQAITPIQAADLEAVTESPTGSNLTESRMLYAVAALSVVSVGLLLLLLGIYLDRRRVNEATASFSSL